MSKSGQANVTDSDALIHAGGWSGSDVLLKNATNGTNVYLGPSGVTTTTGYLLEPGESVRITVHNSPLYAVTAAATSSTLYWVVG